MAEQPSVLYLVTEDWYFWSHRLELARHARDNGYRVLVATRQGEYAASIRREGFELYPLQLGRRAANPLRELLVIRDLVRLYRRVRPDLLHHIALKPVIYGAIAARIAAQPRVISTLAGLGYLYVASGLKVRLIRMLLERLIAWLLDRRGSVVIFQNPDDRARLLEAGAISPGRTELIRGSGVNTDTFHLLPEPQPPLRVLFASRMLWHKGVAEFVEAARRLRDHQAGLRFLMAGRLDPDNPAAVTETQLQEWQASGVIEWLGWREDVPALLAEAHLVCLPSFYGEGVPKVLIEAAAMGRAIITTDTPGCREIVIDGRNGILVPPRSVEALVAAIQKLAQDDALRRQYGKAGALLVRKEFSNQVVLAQTLAVYAGLLDDRHA